MTNAMLVRAYKRQSRFRSELMPMARAMHDRGELDDAELTFAEECVKRLVYCHKSKPATDG